MSVKYSLTPLKSPSNKSEPEKYYAKAQVREVISLDRIAGELAYAASLTRGDVYNVLYNLPQVIGEHIADGDLVDLGGLGKFQFQLCSKGVNLKSEFTHQCIRRAKLQFRPGKLLLKLMGSLQYEEVISLKARREAKRKARQG